MGLRTRNSTTSRSRERVCKLLHATQALANNRVDKRSEYPQTGSGISSWLWSRRPSSIISHGKDISFLCVWTLRSCRHVSLSSPLWVLMLIMWQIVYFFYPETANLTLEEIDFLFTDRARHPSLRSNVPPVNSSDDVLEHHAESKEWTRNTQALFWFEGVGDLETVGITWGRNCY